MFQDYLITRLWIFLNQILELETKTYEMKEINKPVNYYQDILDYTLIYINGLCVLSILGSWWVILCKVGSYKRTQKPKFILNIPWYQRSKEMKLFPSTKII